MSCKLSKSLPLSPLLSCGDQTGQSRPFNKQFFGYEFCSYSVYCTVIIDISTSFSINGLVLNTPCDKISPLLFLPKSEFELMAFREVLCIGKSSKAVASSASSLAQSFSFKSK